MIRIASDLPTYPHRYRTGPVFLPWWQWGMSCSGGIGNRPLVCFGTQQYTDQKSLTEGEVPIVKRKGVPGQIYLSTGLLSPYSSGMNTLAEISSINHSNNFIGSEKTKIYDT